jgi:hypothetical protein
MRALQKLKWIWVQPMLASAIVSVIVSSSLNIGERVVNHAGFIRQQRLQYRPILQSHPVFPADTFLYFIDSPLQTLDVSGLMFLRYGTNVSVSGIDRDQLANLRGHRFSFVYYIDDENQFKEQAVGLDPHTQITPSLPTQFEDSISLSGIEITRADVRRGDALVAILYWRSTQRVNRDYTVFSHLVSSNGEDVAGYDSQPQRGLYRTTAWKPNQLIVDAVVIPIGLDTDLGENYRLELGLYDATNGKRLSLVDANGRSMGDHITISPITIAN